jgi:hypothetical protein
MLLLMLLMLLLLLQLQTIANREAVHAQHCYRKPYRVQSGTLCKPKSTCAVAAITNTQHMKRIVCMMMLLLLLVCTSVCV